MFSSNTSQVSNDAVFVEDVFSTWLYTGNSPSTQSIVNGIDLAGKGGMVWVKSRVSGDGSTYNNILMDTARGTGSGNILYSNLTLAAQTAPNAGISSFNSNGFSLRYDDGYGTNYPSGGTFASWTFRKQAKFFDVVTYTGNGTARTISHSLGSVPGCIIVKRTDSAESWYVYHRSIGAGGRGILNLTDAFSTSGATNWNNTEPTSTQFSLGASSTVNANGGTYVAYLFAHDAGGFGLTGTDNVISCGSFTAAGSTTDVTVNLGYEPQWLLVKVASTNDDWYIYDVMRGMSYTSTTYLRPSSSGAEVTFTTPYGPQPTATGFIAKNSLGWSAGETLIYIAIRRGPMKTPTTGTSVYYPTTYTGTGATRSLTGFGFPPDLSMISGRSNNLGAWLDRLRGPNQIIQTRGTQAETATSNELMSFDQNGVTLGSNSGGGWTNVNGTNYVTWEMRRAPGFFDVVCYTGTGSARTLNHNLGVVPEMMIVKVRNGSGIWMVYHAALGNTGAIYLNDSDIAYYSSTYWNSTTPTSSVFSLGTSGNTNGGAGQTYVNYLFASCPGVSKVGSYTGTGTTKQIDCGFTGGARFVLIKRTDASGDWYVWDSARGIVSGNDPYLLLNSTAAEVTNTDYVDTYSAGFEISSTAPAAINANGGTFVFLAVA